jgi:hypothetical protein
MDVGTATPIMMPRLKALILRLLHEHRVMTMATLRPDGWPQATMVGYVNDGFFLYCFVARSTQKFANIQRDPRVSIAIGSDAANPMQVRGLSLAGHASEVNDRSEASAHRAGAKAHAGRASAHCAGHHLGVGLRARLRPQRARHFFGTRSRCASRDPEPPLERGRRYQLNNAWLNHVSDCCARVRSMPAEQFVEQPGIEAAALLLLRPRGRCARLRAHAVAVRGATEGRRPAAAAAHAQQG